jgi:hypothetical protein
MAAKPQTQSAHASPSGAAARAVYLLGLALLVGSASSPAMAATAHPPMILAQPSSTGAAKTARQKLVKQRTTALNTTPRHPGKIIGGGTTPPPRTIVTRRFLPK